MNIVQVDSPEDPKNGIHLERVLDRTKMRFVLEENAVLMALEEFSQMSWEQHLDHNKSEFELIAVVPVGMSHKDVPLWTFGSGTRGEMKAGGHYIDSGRVQLWLRDSDRRPFQHCADIFIEPFAPLCAAGYVPPHTETSKAKREECREYIRQRIRDGLVMHMQRRRYEMQDLIGQLTQMTRGDEVLRQFLIWSH